MLKLVTNRSFMRIFSVLLIAVMLMFLINYLFFRNSIQFMHKQVKDNNRLVATSIIKSFENSFQDVYNLVYSIDTLPTNLTPSNNEEPYNNYVIYKNLSKLVTSSSSSNFIEEVIIYNESANIAITPQGTIDLNSIFNTYYINSQYNYLYWQSFFNEGNSIKVFPAMNYIQSLKGQTDSAKNLIVIAGKIHRSLNNIMVFIDVKKLLKSADQNGIEDVSFTILDSNNKVLLNTDEDINLVDIVNDFYVSEGNKRFVNNQEYEYVIYKSDYNGFTYINRMPYEDATIMSVISNHRLITFIGLILAILLTYLLSLYLFRPNIMLKKLIGEDYSWKNIYKTITNLKEEKERFKDKINTTDLEVRKDSFLYAIGQSRTRKDIQLQIRDYVNDFFLDRQFLLVKFSVISKKEKELLRKLSIEDLKEIIQEELHTNLKHVTVFHMKDSEFLALIGIHNSSDRTKVIQTVKDFIKKTDHELSDFFLDCHLTASISSVYESNIDNLQLAYQTIVDIPFYRNIDHTSSIYDVESVRYTMETYFPPEKVDQLSNLLISGNDKEAIKIIDKIIDKNIEMKIQYYQFVGILQSLILSMKKHLSLSHENQQLMYALELDFFNSVRQATNYEHAEKSFMKIVAFISEKAIQDKESKLNRAFIAQYIELHYMESLYLEHMADITNTSSRYFSKFFKKAFGVNFIEYLNRVRINRAKEFLKNENYAVSEVGEKTGFMHATTFSSTFKRFTGITPTQYRNRYLDGK